MKVHKLENGILIFENNTNSFEIIFKNFGYKLDNLFNISGLSHFIEHYILSIIKYPFCINGATTINNMVVQFFPDSNYTLEKIIKYIYNNFIINNKFYIKKNNNIIDVIRYDLLEEIYFNQSFNKLSLVELALLYNNTIYGGGVYHTFIKNKTFFNILEKIFNNTSNSDIILSVPKINTYILNIINNTFGNLNLHNKLTYNNFNLPKKVNKNYVLYYSIGYNTSILFTIEKTFENITELLIFKYFYHKEMMSIKLNKIIVTIYFYNENHLKNFLFKILYMENSIPDFNIYNIQKYPEFDIDFIEYSNNLNIYKYLLNIKKNDVIIKFNSFLNTLKNIILQKKFVIFTEKNNFLYNSKDNNDYKYYKTEIDIDIESFKHNIHNIIDSTVYNTKMPLFYNDNYNGDDNINLNSHDDICYFINQSFRHNDVINIVKNTSSSSYISKTVKNYFKYNISCFVYLQLFYFYFMYNINNISTLHEKLIKNDYFNTKNNENNVEYILDKNYNLKIFKEKKYLIKTKYNFICGTFLSNSKLDVKNILSPEFVKKNKLGYSILIYEKIYKNKKQNYFFLCCMNIKNAYKNIKKLLNRYGIKNIIFILSEESSIVDFSNLDKKITISF
jgi:hypothetical protein